MLMTAAVVAGGVLTAQSASATVTFVQTDAEADAKAVAAYSSTTTPDSVTTSLLKSATTLSAAENGLTPPASAHASSSSGGSHTASADADEKTSVQLSSSSAGSIKFFNNPSTSISVGSAATTGSAKAGDNGSYGDYLFDLSHESKIALSWSTTGSHASSDAYTIELVRGGNVIDSVSVASTAAGSNAFNLSAGDWKLLVTESSGAAAPGYLSLSGHGSATGSASGDFTFGISSVPEPSTWAMFLTGFASLAFLGRRRLVKAVA
jgi:hypothetical protein